MKFVNKILNPRILLVLLVLVGGALFTILQGVETTCVSTTDGSLTEQSTFGEGQSTECGSDFSAGYDYIIGAGTFVNWSGFEGAIFGNVEVKSGATLDINGNASFGGTLTNAGTLNVQPQTETSVKPAPTSTFYTISNPTGHTSETGDNSTFNVNLNAAPLVPAPPAPPTAPASDIFDISDPSGHTEEGGATTTFNVSLKDDSLFPSTPALPSVPSSDFFNISNISGNTSEDGTTATFNVALKSAPSANVTVSVTSSDTAEATVSPATLTFTPANYNTTQQVTVTGVDDNDVDGHEEYEISLSATVTVEGYANDITDNLNSSAYTIFGGQSPSYQSVEKAFDGNT
ncbi:MAG: hypothetical protein HOI10_03265, partial [Deltaproteobacteria bacterium]|nr:hypothetical protein [Deltaproteobacteria bacterium]